ncbi:MAG: biotin--[acetyl-CoA-carboxylase] ligase [Planctomycetota bacterium]
MENESLTNLDTKIIGRKVLYFKMATSTNDLAWLEVSRGATEGTVILAGEQLKGRGRFGRTWFAPAGQGIWMSIILKPDLPIEKTSILMITGAIAACEMLREKMNLNAFIRWPNDVMINNKKIAGIILETKYLGHKPEMMVLGIGLNVNLKQNEIPSDLKDVTTSVAIEKNQEVDQESLTSDLLTYLDNWYYKIRIQDYEAVTAAWRKMCALTGKQVIVKTKERQFEGEVVGLDPVKGISLKQSGKIVKLLRSEDVEMIRLK